MQLNHLCAALGAAAALVVAPGFAAAGATAFGPPVKMTPAGGHGYEPAVYTGHYGEVFATAHKANWQLAVAPDLDSPTFTRTMSWAWASSDGKKLGIGVYYRPDGRYLVRVRARGTSTEGSLCRGVLRIS